jgi:ABC-type transport system substrate-binding protein
MSWKKRVAAVSVLAVILTIGCAPRSSNGPGELDGATQSARFGPKRAVLAANTEIDFLHTAGVGGRPELRLLVNPGLSFTDDTGALRPALAEALPSIQNGLWKLHPDGRMETTWTLRPNARWHDGVPFTTADLAFTTEVGAQVPAFTHPGYASIDSVQAVDDRTLVVTWKRPFISADALFSSPTADGSSLPLPRHLIEAALLADRTTVPELPFWTEGYVGLGPFRLRSFTPGSQILLEANPDYVLGRPKLDELEVRIISDTNTRVANILAGELHATMDSLGSIRPGSGRARSVAGG